MEMFHSFFKKYYDNFSLMLGNKRKKDLCSQQ